MPSILPDDVITSPNEEEITRLAASHPTRVRITGWKFDTLEPLEPLAGLTALSLIGVRHLASLAGLERLASLEELMLSTPPEWDGRGRYINVESYRPIASLQCLTTLVITGIRPNDRSLNPIGGLRRLKSLELAHQPDFTLEDLAQLAARLPGVEGRALKPSFTIPGIATCRKCGEPKAFVNGARPGARKWLCPHCAASALQAHYDQWRSVEAAWRGAKTVNPGPDPGLMRDG